MNFPPLWLVFPPMKDREIEKISREWERLGLGEDPEKDMR
jgi:hypothetical protein